MRGPQPKTLDAHVDPMRKHSSLLTPAVAMFAVASLSGAPYDSCEQPVETSSRFIEPLVVEASHPDAPGAACTSVAHDGADESESLAEYVLEAMRTWNRGRMAGSATRLPEIARDIAHVALDEPQVWPESDGAREAILLAAIAWWETRFRDYVDDGSCNRWAREAYRRTGKLTLKVLAPEAQQLMAIGTCDGGLAASIWQIHFGMGIVIDEHGGWHFASGRDLGITRERAMRNRRDAARVALAMARQSIQAGVGLENYVGGGDPIARKKRARDRLEFAERYSRAHPFVRSRSAS